MSKSRDLTATEAIKEIKSLTKVGDIRSFAKGDSRKTVNDAVEATIDKLKTSKSKPAPAAKKAVEKKTTPSR